MHKKNLAPLFLLFIFPLFIAFGCGSEKNPILGKWEVELETGSASVNTVLSVATYFKQPYLEFTETSVIYQLGSMSGDKAITYRHDKNDWYFCTDDGKLCELFFFTDTNKNRVEITFIGIKMILTRVPTTTSDG